jgi:PilZ domain
VEQRRSRRFLLTLPLAITRSGPERVMQSGVTKNISSGGVLFTTETEAELGGAVEYVITLIGSSEPAVNLRCFGKILRCKKNAESEAAGFDIAATLERYEFVRSSD